MVLEQFTIVELTHLLTPQAATWDGGCGFSLEIQKDYPLFRIQQMKIRAGIGTHLDAPAHRIQGGGCIHNIPLSKLIVPAYVVDVSAKADANYQISIQDIQNFEQKYGTIAAGSLVIGRTGWDRLWSNPTAYRNIDKHGVMHFPSFSKGAANLLLQRDVVGIAIDTLSPDSSDPAFPVHTAILGAGKYIIENLANTSGLPPKGASVIALPLLAENAAEDPSSNHWVGSKGFFINQLGR